MATSRHIHLPAGEVAVSLIALLLGCRLEAAVAGHCCSRSLLFAARRCETTELPVWPANADMCALPPNADTPTPQAACPPLADTHLPTPTRR